MKRLIFFTDSYPYGMGEQWKTNELKHLKNYFDEIKIVPYSYGENFSNPKKLFERVISEKPLFENNVIPINYFSFLKLLDKNCLYYFREFLEKKIFMNKKRVFSWLIASLNIKALSSHPTINEIRTNSGNDTVFYFYWGRGSCDIVPFLKKKFDKIVVRFHRYDLYEERNDNYIPYRYNLLSKLTYALPCSQDGCNYLTEKYPEFKHKIKLSRLGTVSIGQSSISNDKILRIVSCSKIVPVKRLEILVNSLKLIKFPVEWTHIGDGPLMKEIKRYAEMLPPNIKMNLVGFIKSEDVLKYYVSNCVDLFINVSSSEGVPVSIMEAFSAGISVFATNVGGTGEIVDDSVGKILPSDITPTMLAEEITKFYLLPIQEKLRLRKNANNRYHEMCNADVITEEFAKFLSS